MVTKIRTGAKRLCSDLLSTYAIHSLQYTSSTYGPSSAFSIDKAPALMFPETHGAEFSDTVPVADLCICIPVQHIQRSEFEKLK